MAAPTRLTYLSACATAAPRAAGVDGGQAGGHGVGVDAIGHVLAEYGEDLAAQGDGAPPPRRSAAQQAAGLLVSRGRGVREWGESLAASFPVPIS